MIPTKSSPNSTMFACMKLKKISKFISFVIFSVLLSACETEQAFDSPEAYGPLRIIGGVSGALYVGTEFDVEFGVTGGQAPYKYRYLKQRPEGSEFEDIQSENTLDLSIEVVDGAKPAFRLKGIVTAPEAGGNEDSTTIKSTFYLEVTDGIDTVVEEYVYTLYVPEARFPGAVTPSERADNVGAFTSALRVISFGNGSLYCRNVQESPYPTIDEVDGRPVRTIVLGFELQRTLVESVQMSYRITSAYNEQFSETSEANLGKARPGVDFVEKEGVMVFDAGARLCVVSVHIFDDEVIEGKEDFRIEVFDRVGANVNISGVDRSTFSITDNEPSVSIEPVVGVVNVGESASVPLKLASSGVERYLNFGVDEILTDAQPGTFELVPQNGVSVFPDSAVNSSMGVRVLSQDSERLGPDRQVALFSAADHINDIEPSVFVINEWPRGGLVENELIPLVGDELSVVAMAGDDNGRVHVLKHAVDALGFSYVVVSSMYRDGSVYKLTDSSDDLVIRKAGVNIEPKGIAYTASGDGALVVVSEVDAAFDGQHQGLIDFLVQGFRFNSDGFASLVYAKQYGSESDDSITGLTMSDSSLYVFGGSSGLQFDGVPGSQSNRGGLDGFVYRLDGLSGVKQWSTFIGDEGTNNVEALAASRLEIYPLVSQDVEGKRSFIRLLDQSGQPDEGVPDSNITPISAHNFVSSIVIGGEDEFTILSDGTSHPLTGLVSESRTRDVFIGRIDASLEGSSSLTISTSGVDVASAQAYLTDKEILGVVGSTTGEFAGNSTFGSEDAFFSAVKTDDGVRFNSVTQFGTQGNDKAIDIMAVGDSKFLVLWQEDFTSGDGSLNYRISAFSFDGHKLSPDF
jgi:hypothetical protein